MQLSTPLHHWRNNRLVAYVAPLAVFMLLMTLPGLFEIAHPDVPWYRRAPEQWAYPLQTLVCGLLLLFWWSQYGWKFLRLRHVFLAAGVGLLGIFIWILPAELHIRFGWGGSESLLRFFGLQERVGGFDPDDAPLPLLAIVLRMLRLVIIVPLVEEIFWRGFLMRYLVRPDGNYWKVPFGTHHPRAYWVTTLLITAVHQPADWAVAFIWASLIYVLAVRTRSLLACVLAHAVANAVLGIYVLHSGYYGFW